MSPPHEVTTAVPRPPLDGDAGPPVELIRDRLQVRARTTDHFRRFSARSAQLMGRPASFAIASVAIVGWALCGHFFHFSETWELVVNTGTTIVTFIAVFLIQTTQNADAKAIQLKLDELLRANEAARDRLIRAEEGTTAELIDMQMEFEALLEDARAAADAEEAM
jgi:low affinity Fe/Cu permease